MYGLTSSICWRKRAAYLWLEIFCFTQFLAVYFKSLEASVQYQRAFKWHYFHHNLVLKLCSFSLQDKLLYFPVCVSRKKKSKDETEEGLGSLPRNISSVSSLLLFNTTENLWVHTHTHTFCVQADTLLLALNKIFSSHAGICMFW